MVKQQRKSRFAYIPRDVAESRAFMTLPGRAAHLLVFVASKYTGYNNGDIEATYNELYRMFGWHTNTCVMAFKHLNSRGLLIQTRKGRIGGLCSLYALSWKPISEQKVEKIRAYGYEGPLDSQSKYRTWSLECVS